MRPVVVLGVAFAIFTTAAVDAALITATWIGPGDGSWSEAAKWSRVGVPNNGGGNTYAAVIQAGGAFSVTLNQDASVDTLSLGADDSLSFNNDRDLAITVGPITNEGLVMMNSIGNGTDLRVGANFTIAGSGEWVLGDHPNNIFRNNFGAITRLTNGVNHTISGAGQIGINSLFFTNSGLVDANLTNAMQFDLREEETNVNTGTMQASLGGTLNLLNSGTLENTTGVIQALDLSVVNLINTSVVSGTLDTDGTGAIRPSTSVPALIGITNLGLIQHTNDLDCIYSGTITNEGTISLESIGNSTEMRLATSPTTFTGRGVIDMSDHVNNFIRNNFGAVTRLHHDANHIIAGAGQIGGNSLFMTNEGLIDANNVSVLQIDLREEETNFNTGGLQASQGGSMVILNSGIIDNTDGVIQALHESVLHLQGTTIKNGLLNTLGTGVVRPSTNVPALEDVTNEGLFEMTNDLDCIIINSITNNDTISMLSTGNGTDLRLHSLVTSLTGTGIIEMGDHANNFIRNNFGAVTRLHHDVDHTIRGAGQIGVNSLFLTNDGLIEATLSNALQFDLREEETNFNNGTMQATGGGTLNFLNSGIVDNTNGVIQALDGSVVNLMGTTILGGTLDTADSGVVQGSTNVPILTDVTNDGLFRLFNDADVVINGTLTNNDTFEMNSAGNGTDIRINTAVGTITGPGEIVMGNHPNNFIRNNFGSVTQFVNGADHTIRGGGQIGLNTIGIINDGTIISNVSAGISFDPRSEAGGFVNNGLLHVTGKGGVTIHPDPFTNAGDVVVDATRKLTRNGNYDQTAGTTTASGEVEVNNGTFNLQGGVLNGSGLVDANVVNSGGSVEPGESIGLLSVEGNYTQTIAGALTIEIENVGTPGSDHDQLALTGNATLGGVLRLESFNGYTPQIGDTFTVLTASAVLGRFHAVIPCGTYEVSYTATTVEIEVISGPPVLGDLSCDGDADFQDAGFLCLQLGLTSADPNFNPQADLNDDGEIDYEDRAIMDGIVSPCTGDVVSSTTFQPPADGVVDGADLAFLLGNWGAGLSCADTVSSATFAPPPDGIVDGADLAVLLGAWGPCD
jgi:hypothetical protein